MITYRQMEQIQCSNCKVRRDADLFVGKSGQCVKRCLKCREKDDKQKRKQDVIVRRNDRQRTAKYYQKYRENKKAENLELYRSHNAKVMRQWTKNNKEHLSEWRKNNINSRLNGIKGQAKKKNYHWDEDMTYEICSKMMSSPCFYCSFIGEERVNGIDRMDNSKGYSATNCVGACKTCNFIKRCTDARTFINRCIHVASCHGHGSSLFPEAWPVSKQTSFDGYLNRANKKNIEFQLTRSDYDVLCMMPCHYCRRQITNSNTSGVDRVDNERGYTIDNVVPACSECNLMKGTLHANQFIDSCTRVSKHANPNLVPDMVTCLHSIVKRNNILL